MEEENCCGYVYLRNCLIDNNILREECQFHHLNGNGTKQELLLRLHKHHETERRVKERGRGVVSEVDSLAGEYTWEISARAITISLAQENEVESPVFGLCGKTWRIRLEKEGKDLEIFLDSVEEDDSFSAEYKLKIQRNIIDGSERSEHWLCDLSHGGWGAGWGMPNLDCIPLPANLESYKFTFTITVYGTLTHEKIKTYNKEVVCMKQPLKDLYEYAIQSDVEIVLKDQKRIKAHKAILSMHSEVFDTMFKPGFLENLDGVVEICDSDPKIVKRLIEYFYTGEIDEKSNFEELFMIADKYKVDTLASHCVLQMIKKINIRNACDYLILLKRFCLLDEEEVKKKILKFITENLAEIKDTPGFQKVLRDSDLTMIIFTAVAKEPKGKGKKRKRGE